MTEDIKDIPVEVDLNDLPSGYYCGLERTNREDTDDEWTLRRMLTPKFKTKKAAVSAMEKLITDIGFKNVKRNYKRSRYV